MQLCEIVDSMSISGRIMNESENNCIRLYFDVPGITLFSINVKEADKKNNHILEAPHKSQTIGLFMGWLKKAKLKELASLLGT